MKYVYLIVCLAVGIINLIYLKTEREKIPNPMRYLVPKKFIDIFLFIPEDKRAMATRAVIIIGCFALAWQTYRFF